MHERTEMPIKPASFLLVALSIGACTDPPKTPPTSAWSLAQLGAGDLHATGLSIAGNTGNLWLLAPGVGLVEATPQGQHVSTIPFDAAFVDYGFTDVAVLADGSFALAAAGEGYRYDRAHGESAFFCLVPSPESRLDNQALAFDAASGAMYVAPAYFDSSNTLVSASITSYASSDGHFMANVDVMASGVLAQGIAVDHELGRMWVVQHGELYRFTMDGTMDGHTSLAGISEAAGIALQDGKLFVLDGTTQTIRVFDRTTVLGQL
jgi:hypothetical protein